MNSDDDIFKKHRGKLLLALIFSVLGILLVTVGVLRTVFVIFCAAAGFFFGYFFDDKETVRRFLNNYLGK